MDQDYDIGLFFFRPQLGGGTSTFTAHLYKALESAGHRPLILKVRKRGEYLRKTFGEYEGVQYMNIDEDGAFKAVRRIPTLMCCQAEDKLLPRPGLIHDLMKKGMRIVLHDTLEFRVFNGLTGRQNRDQLVVAKLPGGQPPFCIRETMLKFYPNGIFIPHPYMRSFTNEQAVQARHSRRAVSVARLAPVKRPQIILEANRLVDDPSRVVLRGAEYRLFTYNLQKKYPDVFQQCGKTFQFPLTFDAPVQLCSRYQLNVDMSKLPEDGGGTQYSMLEAMDAGTVNVMHKDWFQYTSHVKANRHVLTVKGPNSLARLLQDDDLDLESVQQAGFKLLKKHSPEVIGPIYANELLRG